MWSWYIPKMSFQAFPETRTNLKSTCLNSEKWFLTNYLSEIKNICGRFTKVLVGIPDIQFRGSIHRSILVGQGDDVDSCFQHLENF